LHKAIVHHFPELYEELSKIPDFRRKSEYDMTAILLGAISLFLFKEESRNSFNLDRTSEQFAKNYEQVFGNCLPHMDTVNRVLARLDEEHLEKLKELLVRRLIENRVFHKFRVFKQYFKISIDATGLYSFDKEPYDGCPFRQYKKKKVWIQPVLEAKLVTENGFSISIATEWILNGKKYDKQDCERKAFVRIAKKIKASFPRLPICILADGLYPNQTFFEVCKQNKWQFIITFKDTCLKSVWKTIGLELPKYPDNKTSRYEAINTKSARNYEYTWLNAIDYRGYEIHWLETKETIKNLQTGTEVERRFVHLTSLKVNSKNAAGICHHGRQRWKIENEGFKNQKKEGYALQHKYARKNLKAIKNFYQALQIAHLFHQLATLAKTVKQYWQQGTKLTLKQMFKEISALMLEGSIDHQIIQFNHKHTFQFRY